MLEWDEEDREKQPGHGRNKIALRPQPNLVGQRQTSELEEGSSDVYRNRRLSFAPSPCS